MEAKVFAQESLGTIHVERGLFRAELAIGEPWRYASSQVHRFPTTLTVIAPSRIAPDRLEERFTVFREFSDIAEELPNWLLALEPALLAALGFDRGISARAVRDRAAMRLLLALADGVKELNLAVLP